MSACGILYLYVGVIRFRSLHTDSLSANASTPTIPRRVYQNIERRSNGNKNNNELEMLVEGDRTSAVAVLIHASCGEGNAFRFGLPLNRSFTTPTTALLYSSFPRSGPPPGKTCSQTPLRLPPCRPTQTFRCASQPSAQLTRV